MSDCPICGGRLFEEFSGRPAALCTGCGALERQRALARVCSDLLADGGKRRCLEVGPKSRVVYGDYLRKRGWNYVAVDKWRTGNPHDPRAVGFIDHEADVADLRRFDDASVDLVIAQHVIEEVPDYFAALQSIHRVLHSGGVALLDIPYDPSRERSASHAPGRFGNVWVFGSDLIEELRSLFSRVVLLPLEEGDYRGELMVCTA